jgi:hypothetical protein
METTTAEAACGRRTGLRAVVALALMVSILAWNSGPVEAAPLSDPVHAADGSGADWLGEINLYRVAAGLKPVSDEPSWSAGLQQHFLYLNKTPASYRTGQYASEHSENPSSPYFTIEGARAGGSSNLISGGIGLSPVDFIDKWLAAPFHAIGMLRPGLVRVAFASDPATGRAGLDVLSGYNSAGGAAGPVLFPGSGMTTNLASFSSGESPDPLETCGWRDQQVGLPLIALLPRGDGGDIVAQLAGPGGLTSTSGGGLCVVDARTYRSSDPVYGPTGGQILAGDNAVLLIPHEPLSAGSYTATIAQAGEADLSWSFTADPDGLSGPAARVSTLRFAGSDRVATAVTISQARFPRSGTAAAAVLARSDQFPDALAGGPFAAARKAPLLLTDSEVLDSRTVSEVARVLRPGGTVFLLGGANALSPTIAAALAQLGYQTTRIAGPNRYATAVAIANATGGVSTIFEVTAHDFTDALISVPAAVQAHGVLLLTDGDVPAIETTTYLAGVPASTRYAVGRPAAAADPTARAFVGADPYQTSALVAASFFAAPASVGLASGLSFPDGLAAGPLLGDLGAPLLLSAPTALPPAVQGYLAIVIPGLKGAKIFGGTSALDRAVERQVRALGSH